MKKFSIVFLTLLAFGVGFYVIDLFEKSYADDPPPACTDCDDIACYMNEGKCYISVLFCLTASCLPEEFYFWYKIDDPTGVWASTLMVTDIRSCDTGCEPYTFASDPELECDEQYLFQVTCGDTRGENIQCQGIFSTENCD